MPFYETVYETGRMSVAEYEDDAEAQSAIGVHHGRAVRGEPGGPVGAPAERIAAVYVYDKHPDAFNEAQTASADVVQKEVEGLLKKMKDENGVVALDRLALAVRDLSYPMVYRDERAQDAFGSFYKMKENRKLPLDFLEEGGK